MASRTLFILSFLVAAAAPAIASDKKAGPLEISVSHYIAPAQSDVRVRLRVEPDERSRDVTLEWLSDDLSGGSTVITLDGARAAAAHQYMLKRLSPGKYTVTAVLRRSDGSQVKRDATVTVVGMRGD
jgi:hypothetical protein